MRVIATGKTGSVGTVVTYQDDVAVNECRIGTLWYRFDELEPL